MDRIELVLNPVRMRVILTLAHRTLTTRQLAALLPDIPQTTLYRHINLLLEGGVVRVVRESKVRGTTERELALVEGAGRIDLETSVTLSSEQQDQLFTTFLATLLADFRRSQAQPQAGMPPALYTRDRLYLSTAELHALNQQVDALLSPYKDPARASADIETQPWLFTGIIMQDSDMPRPEEEEDPQ